MLGDQRLLDPITRGMSFFLVSQQGAPNPGWSLQYTLDLKPAAARTYEPLSLATHTTASNLEHLLTFYELTGDTRYLARVPEGIDWLERVQAGEAGCRRQNASHVHRAADQSRRSTCTGAAPTSSTASTSSTTTRRSPIGHYSPTRKIDTAGLRKRYEDARKADVQALAKNSPLAAGRGHRRAAALLRGALCAARGKTDRRTGARLAHDAECHGLLARAVAADQPSVSRRTSKASATGDFASTHVGDETDTSPFTDTAKTTSISTAEYLRNMNILVHWLSEAPR